MLEESILGTLLKEPHLLSDTVLRSEFFAAAENRVLLNSMKEILHKKRPLDAITLLTSGDMQGFGGAGKLDKISKLANVDKFDSYVEMLTDKWREREKNNILEIARHENWSIEAVTKKLDELTSNKADDYNDITDLLIEVAESPWQERDIPMGAHTGLKALQAATNGLQNSELIILAARPSMGKTDVMLHLAKNAGWNDCIPIVFSLEMSARSLRDRLIASTGNYNRSKLKDVNRRLTGAQKNTWMQAIGRVQETKMQIFDHSGQTVPEIRMKIRKIKNENTKKQIIVFIDYLTLIKPIDNYKGNMHLATSDISKGLKSIAKEFDCPVVSLAQLSRSVEKRPDKRPMLSDLRESGSIEEDAHVVMFLYRDAYYSKEENDNSLEIIIAKQRNGEVGTINAEYNKFTGAIYDV